MRGGPTIRRLLGMTCAVIALLSGSVRARGDGPAPKLLIELPSDGAYVGAKFRVTGRVTSAPQGTVVRLDDQKATVGPGGAFQFDVVSAREGRRQLRVTCTVAGKALHYVRTVTGDLTAPRFEALAPQEETAELTHADAVVLGRLVDAAPVTLRVDGGTVQVGADGSFQVHYKLPPGVELVVNLEGTDAAGNTAHAVRRLRRKAGLPDPVVRISGRSAQWIARDGARITLPFNPKDGAAAVLAHELKLGPLTSPDGPLIVRLERSVARGYLFWRVADTLSALGLPVALAPHASEERRRRWPVETLRIRWSPADAARTGGWSLRLTDPKDAPTWHLSEDGIAAFTKGGESPEGRRVAEALAEIAEQRERLRVVPTIRLVSEAPLDVRLLRALGKPPFQIDDVIFVDSEPVAYDSGSSPGAPLIGIGGGGNAPRIPTLEQRTQVAAAIDRAVTWLTSHQRPDGSWSGAGWSSWCRSEPYPEGAALDGSGRADVFDVGITGLALLALLDAEHLGRGDRETVATIARGMTYLVQHQKEAGRFGALSPEQSVYNHAIATQAVIRAFAASGNPTWRESAQRALDTIAKLQIPESGWGYASTPGGGDTSVTGWMGMALISAADANFADVHAGGRGAFTLLHATEKGLRTWFERVTDPATGRVGYAGRGAGPNRAPERAHAFPASRSEAMTALGLLAQVAWFGADPRTSSVVKKGAALCAALPPVWAPKEGSIDMCYWYFGTLAMTEIGGAALKVWDRSLGSAIVDTQRSDGSVCTYLGSWDPIDPWGPDGGRVYSTALMTLCLAHWYDPDGRLR